HPSWGCSQRNSARQQLTAPPNMLLQGAYTETIASLKVEGRVALDRDYVEAQVEYQKSNAAFFQYEIQNGTNPDLKRFAQRTLPNIEDASAPGPKTGQNA